MSGELYFVPTWEGCVWVLSIRVSAIRSILCRPKSKKRFFDIQNVRKSLLYKDSESFNLGLLNSQYLLLSSLVHTIAKHVSTRVSILQILELYTFDASSGHFHADIHCPNGSSFLENVQSQDMVLYSIYPRRLLYVNSLPLQSYPSMP